MSALTSIGSYFQLYNNGKVATSTASPRENVSGSQPPVERRADCLNGLGALTSIGRTYTSKATARSPNRRLGIARHRQGGDVQIDNNGVLDPSTVSMDR